MQSVITLDTCTCKWNNASTDSSCAFDVKLSLEIVLPCFVCDISKQYSLRFLTGYQNQEE